MTKAVYSLFDRVVGSFGDPITFVNDEDCYRRVAIAYKDNPFSIDLDLYYIGVFDLNSGVFDFVGDKPMFNKCVADIVKEYYSHE